MKYDGYQILPTTSYPNENVERRTRKRAKINLLDIFIVQSVICVAISCGVMISRLIGLGL